MVLANQWAALDDTTVAAADTTRMLVTDIQKVGATAAKDQKITLDATTDLDAVGLTYDAYVSGKTASKTTLVLTEGANTVAYNEGKGVNNGNRGDKEWASIAKLAETENLVTDADTQWFINYADEWYKDVTSEYRISYAIAKESLNGLDAVTKNITWKEYIDELKVLTKHGTIPSPADSDYPGHYLGERTIKIDLDLNGTIEDDEKIECYVVAISPKNVINEIDQAIMQRIFYTADRIGNNGTLVDQLQNYAVGEVYVGTTSMKDYSDTWSWADFQEEYFTAKVNSEKFSVCEIGNSLRIVDNDGDGKAEYVLKIEFNQDKVVGTYKSELLCNHVALADYPEGNLRYCPEELSQGMIVNYSIIDKKLSIWPAEIVTDKIQTKTFKNYTVTTASGDTFNNSQIDNYTGLDEDIMQMLDKTEYNMYLDTYRNIRSYELAQGHKYALLTEMYPTTDRNGNYIRDFQAIAEVKIADADVEEYPIATGSVTNGNLFFNSYIWTWGIRGWFNVGATTGTTGPVVGSQLYNANYLQPAVAHLGYLTGVRSSTQLVSGAVKTGYTDNEREYTLPWNTWNRAVADMRPYPGTIQPGTGGDYGVFDYNVEGPVDADQGNLQHNFSFTNVATYVDNDGTLTLGSASKLAKSHVNGAQLYRVSTAAAFGTGKTALYGNGTEADLIAAYDAYVTVNKVYDQKTDGTNLTTGRDWFDYFTGSSFQNGTGIYPIYETDYIHLDLTVGDMGQAFPDGVAVKSGIRHFHIDDDYDTLYNTNSNNYVDATSDTEFYIVLPGSAKSIMYKVGYADLPTILASEIRAAYAVATNTTKDSDGQDYWVADVVVIETSQLNNAYESISLVYNNPYETTGEVRYADTLNNQWKALQPDYADQAMMSIVPQAGTMNNLTWGNSAWSLDNNGNFNYGFWKLYETQWAEPNQLTVGRVDKITSDYNTYGIYAGEVTRLERLMTRKDGYMDVTTQNTGCVQTYAIDVNYGEANEVPFYRITGSYAGRYTATKLVLNEIVAKSEIHNGDKLIWVYNQAKNELAFVVVVCEHRDADNNLLYATPNWLNAAGQLYDSIDADQKKTPAGPAPTYKYTLTIDQVGPNGEDLGTLTFGTNTENGPVTFNANDLALDGYTTNSLTNTLGTNVINIPTSTAAVSGLKYWTVNLSANQTWTATYTATSRNLTLTDTITATTLSLGLNGVTPTAYTSGTPTATVKDTTYRFVLTGLNKKLNDYSVTVTSGATGTTTPVESWNDAGTILTITGTMNGTAVVAISVSATPKAVTEVLVNAGTGTVVSFVTNDVNGIALAQVDASAGAVTGTSGATGDAGDVFRNVDSISFRIDDTRVAANNQVGIVTYTPAGGSATPVPVSGGIYTVPAVNVATVTIDVPVVATAQTVNLTKNGLTTESGTSAAGPWTALSGTTLSVDYNTGTAYVKTSAPAKATADNDASVTADSTNTIFTITGVTATTAVTFTPLPSVPTNINTTAATGSFAGLAPMMVPAENVTVTEGADGVLNVSVKVPFTNTYSSTSATNYPGFGANGAAVVAGCHANNPDFPADAEKFAFYAFEFWDPNKAGGSAEQVIMAVAPGMTSGRFTSNGVTYVVHYTNLEFLNA